MTSQVLEHTDIVSAILAAEGDLSVVAERTNSSVIDVREKFLHEISKHDGVAAASIEALLLLNQLQMLGELRVVIMASLPELAVTDLLKVHADVNATIKATLVRISPVAEPVGDIINNNFNGNDLIDRLTGRLADLTRNDDPHQPANQLTAPPKLIDTIVTGRD